MDDTGSIMFINYTKEIHVSYELTHANDGRLELNSL